jgi:Sec-independent protein secretion pathway component TatC
MFYVKEIIHRIQYFFLSLFLSILISYLNRDTLMFLLTQSVFLSNQYSFSNINHFIYTHPVELFTVQILLILYFSLLVVLPFLLWQILDFLKSSLILIEYQLSVNVLLFFLFLILTFNLVSFFYLLPNIWCFFNSFNTSLDLSKTFDFVLELRIQEYFLFIINFIYIINISLLVLIFAILLFMYYGLKNLVYWKKLFIFLNMMFATLLSPPDVSSQLLIFFFLTFCFEIIIGFYIFLVKLYKQFYFNMVAY